MDEVRTVANNLALTADVAAHHFISALLQTTWFAGDQESHIFNAHQHSAPLLLS